MSEQAHQDIFKHYKTRRSVCSKEIANIETAESKIVLELINSIHSIRHLLLKPSELCTGQLQISFIKAVLILLN